MKCRRIALADAAHTRIRLLITGGVLLAVLAATGGMATRAAATDAAVEAGSLDLLAERADHSWITQLNEDPEAAQHAPNRASRQVTTPRP